MKKILAFICLFWFVTLIQAQQTISFRLKNYDNSKCFLSSVYGSQSSTIDSVEAKNGWYRFKFSEKLPAGIYKLSVSDSLFVQIIVNNENIVIESQSPNIIETANIIESRENKVLFDYWKKVLITQDSLRKLQSFQKLYQKQNEGKYDAKLTSQIKKVNSDMDAFSQKLIDKSKGLFVSKVILAYQQPNYDLYSKKAGAIKYSNIREFYAEHFFDNLDFTDSRFLRTDIIYNYVFDFLKNFGQQSSTEKYKALVDYILSKAAVNLETYKYVLNLLINNFEFSIWENVYVHLIDNHYLKMQGADPVISKQHRLKSNSIKNIQQGMIIPGMILNDTNLRPFDFFSINSKAKLLVFWNVGCEHCEELMPHIIEIYSAYKSSGLELVAIALTDDEIEWKKNIHKYKMNCTNLSDLKGMLSEIVTTYNVWMTPSLFLLNSENQIIGKPRSVNEIHSKLVEIFR